MFRNECLVCESDNLKEIINLGMHPFADTFIPLNKISEADLVYPLICDLCTDCGHVQTKCVTDPKLRYAQHDYSYTSSNSNFSRTHWEEYCTEMVSNLNLGKGSLVVEVGSNDGYLSEQFKKQGLRAIGVDPSPYMAELAKQKNVDTIVDLFDEEVGKIILEKHGKADLIAANNVYNHSENPLRFTKAVANVLSSNGYFVFEQPYWLTTIQSGKFDQIYHEHVSYYTVKSAKKLLERAGMKIKSASIVNYHGESLRIIAQLASELKEEPEEVARMIEKEEKYGLFSEELYKNYMAENVKNRNLFLEKVYKIKNEGGSIIAVGAAAKGNTFLNFYSLDNNTLDYVTDSSPYKKGKFTPATRIPIVGDDIFGKYLNKKVYALILSWNIADQLRPILNKINPNIQFISPD